MSAIEARKSLISEDIPSTTLPPMICINERKCMAPEQVDPNSLVLPHRSKTRKQSVLYPIPDVEPCPRYPLTIVLSPEQLVFELHDEPIIRKLCIWNSCARTIYIHCCGLWNDTARLGASWLTYPRTRFRLAPGLKADLFVKATPRTHSPIRHTLIGLQLAASHMRDNITGYYVVPVEAKFLTYTSPCFGEGE